MYSNGAVEASYGDSYALGKSIPYMQSSVLMKMQCSQMI
ncbi:hypothetical protein [Salmonella phage SD-2_S15]|nr:hypothetical protein [Salmonella phage SD-2_S15]